MKSVTLLAMIALALVLPLSGCGSSGEAEKAAKKPLTADEIQIDQLKHSPMPDNERQARIEYIKAHPGGK